MNNTFSLQQIPQTGNLDSNLSLRQFKLHVMVRFMETKDMSMRLTQKEITKELGYPTSSLQRYRRDINMLSPYKIPPNSHKTRLKISNREHALERPRLTSKESSPIIEMVKPNTSKESKLKSGGNFEINNEYLDEILNSNNL